MFHSPTLYPLYFPFMSRSPVILFLLLFCASAGSFAQQRAVDRTWLFGIGASALYDNYLSPLDYHGPSASIAMTNERRARWGKGRVSSFARWNVQASMGENPSKNAEFYDGNVDISLGWHYNWHFPRHWTLKAGALAEFSLGGTYSSRGGNNPAQGRAAFDIAASVMADYHFRLRSHPCSLRLQADAPVAGMMFSPQYGQSYYEIFSLRHYDHNVSPTYPGNVPSLHFSALLTFPLRKARIVAGYQADVRQNHVNHLRRHAWSNAFVVGFRRHLLF